MYDIINMVISMYQKFLDDLRKKYNYDDNLINAIKISIVAMVDTYGEENINKILNLFYNTRIFSTGDMSKESRDKIRKTVLGESNSDIVEDLDNVYGTNIDPGAFYSYEAIYDENMDVVGEKRRIVVNDLSGKVNEEGYKKLFNTSINMPYFLHELNHAYAMQTPIYEKNNNEITSKHGMFKNTIKYDISTDNKKHVKDIDNQGIITEEMINEMYTQRQLIKILNKSKYEEVENELNNINHVSTSYNSLLIMFANELENLIGKERLSDYREKNDFSVIKEFNDIVKNSEIAKKYIGTTDAFEYFSSKCYELFDLSLHKYQMDIDKYKLESYKIMVDVFAPICAYKEVKYGTSNLEKYENSREEYLGTEEKQYKTK